MPSPLQTRREEFPLLASCVYLNSNSTGAVPRGARAALDAYWRTLERWRDEAWEGWWHDLNAYTDELAALLGAPAGSVICDANVSTLFSRLLSCFDYRDSRADRPRVVTSDREFPAIPHVLRAFERYGAKPVIVPSRDGLAARGESRVSQARAIGHHFR